MSFFRNNKLDTLVDNSKSTQDTNEEKHRELLSSIEAALNNQANNLRVISRRLGVKSEEYKESDDPEGKDAISLNNSQIVSFLKSIPKAYLVLIRIVDKADKLKCSHPIPFDEIAKIMGTEVDMMVGINRYFYSACVALNCLGFIKVSLTNDMITMNVISINSEVKKLHEEVFNKIESYEDIDIKIQAYLDALINQQLEKEEGEEL